MREEEEFIAHFRLHPSLQTKSDKQREFGEVQPMIVAPGTVDGSYAKLVSAMQWISYRKKQHFVPVVHYHRKWALLNVVYGTL